MFLAEGLQFLFEFMTNQSTLPTDFYIGWATNQLSSINAAWDLADLTELSGNGYARQKVAPGQSYAEGSLTLDEQVSDGDTVTIDTVTYRFKYAMAQAEDVKIGATKAATQEHLRKTMNGTGSAGTDYYTGSTSPHTTVEMDAWSSDVAIVRARTAGSGGNSIATTSSLTIDSGGTNGFDDTTLGSVRAGAWELVSAAGGLNGRKLTTHLVTFEADGGNWSLAQTQFLTNVASGTSGVLIGVDDLAAGNGVTLLDGQSYDSSLVLLGEPA